MQKTIKSIGMLVLAASLAVVVMPSCKKYPEGPSLSLRSKKARLVNKWKLTKFVENGTDKSADLNDITQIIEIKDDGNYEVTTSIKLTTGGTYTDTETGTWEWSNDKKDLSLKETNATESDILNILLLKNDELKLKKTKNSDVEEMTFVSAE